MAGYLPPVVVDVVGRDKDLIATLARDKAALAAFAKETARAHLGADAGEFESDLNSAKAQLLDFARQVSRARLGADATQFWTEIAALRAELGAMSPLDINVDANTSRALAKIEALRGALALSQVDSLIPAAGAGAAGGGGRGGILGFLGGLFAGRGGRGGRGGIASMLGFGAAAGPLGLAGIGTLGSYAGLGLEHLLMTGVGLAGNAVGGMLGGSLLGLGSMGVMGVGMGTDMAGMGQAVGDVRAYTQAQDKLNRAIAVYGKNSIQAKAAQYDLNQVMEGWLPIVQQSIARTSAVANQFHMMFDQMTGRAEATGADILTQAMQVGMKFLPTIGKYAAQNMGIIRSSLQPLFTWLQGPGLEAFNRLEAKFQQDLPTAMHAFDQGVELLMRTLSYLAPQTGGLIALIDKLVTRFNNGGWTQWEVGIQHLIGDFRNWEALIKILVADIYQLFHADAGTATSIVTSLTQMLTKLHQWETSTQGQAQMHNLFETHKQEILQLLQLLPVLLSGFGRIEMTVAPEMTTLLTGVLKVVNALLKIPGVGPILAWVAAMGYLAKSVGLLKPAMTLLRSGFMGIAGAVGPAARGLLGLSTAEEEAAAGTGILDVALTALTTVGILALAVGIYELYTHFGLLKTAMILGGAAVIGLTAAFWALDAVPIVALIAAIGLAIVGLIAAIYELVTHWKTVWNTIKSVATDVWGFLKSKWGWLLAAFMPPIGPLVALIAHWGSVWDTIKSAAEAVWGFLKSKWGWLLAAFMPPIGALVALMAHWSTVWNTIKSVVSTVWDAIKAIWNTVSSAANTDLISPIRAVLGVWQSVWGGITSVVQSAWGVLSGIFSAIGNGVSTIIGDVSKVTSAIGSITHLGSGGILGSIAHGIGGVLSHIPGLAEGGLVTKPTLAIVGEAGPELVLPLRGMRGIVGGAGISPLPTGGGYAAGGVTMTTVVNVYAPTGNSGDISAALNRALEQRDQKLISTLRAGTPYS